MKPSCVLIGFIGKIPLAGMALANIHYIVGLKELGYDVHYLEVQSERRQLYDPARNEMTDDCTYALRFIENTAALHGLGRHEYSFIDADRACHGADWNRLRDALARADFVLNIGDPVWIDELAGCENRAFVDFDPMFTQVKLLDRNARLSEVVRNYGILFTEGLRVGEPDCLVPTAAHRWLPVPPVVASSLWLADAGGRAGPASTLMNWSSGAELQHEGRAYGYKDREFVKFESLPSLTNVECIVALGGAAPRERLRALGWKLVNPIEATQSIASYKAFIARSSMDIGIAKHAYVETRCGWLSDRSTCYMASGRPVIHQDTGLAQILPTGEGLVLVDTVEQAAEALHEILGDYERHSAAARAIVEEFCEASIVIRRMISAAGWA